MQLADLLGERLDVEKQDVWENERTPTPACCFAVRLHSMGLSLREVEAVLDWLGVDCCHRAVRCWKETLADTRSDPPTASPSRVAVDEKRIEVNRTDHYDSPEFLLSRVRTPSATMKTRKVFGPLNLGV